MAQVAQERRRTEDLSSSLLNAARESIDPETGLRTIKLFSGDWYVSTRGSEMLATILGSCVATCIRDPLSGVGGMNHFLLPGEPGEGVMGAGARYGVNAMERLINGVLNAGGRRDRLEIKVFGGGNVTNNSARIGSKNAAFVRDFLRREGLTIHAQDLEGELPRRLHYFPDTGKVLLRRLRRVEDLAVVKIEENYAQQLVQETSDGDVELFG